MTDLCKSRLPGLALLLAAGVLLAGCNDHSVPGSPGVPEPIKVLENPRTGKRARFFKEIWYKCPKGYNADKLLAEWVAAKEQEGFTREVSPEQDRPAWREARARAR